MNWRPVSELPPRECLLLYWHEMYGRGLGAYEDGRFVGMNGIAYTHWCLITPPAEPSTTDVESVLADALEGLVNWPDTRFPISADEFELWEKARAALELRRKATNNLTPGRDIFRDENRSIVDIDSV